MNPFLPKDYTMPQTSSGGGNYLKLPKGDTRLRILAGFSNGAVMGFEYWSEDSGKRLPVRVRTEGEVKRESIALESDGKPGKVKHFWALPVYNYGEKRIQIWEVTQAGIQNAIIALAQDEDWGDPTGYDITIKREGDKLETTYSVINKPAKPLDAEVQKLWDTAKSTLNLSALFEGGDPFSGGSEPAPTNDEEINIDEIDL